VASPHHALPSHGHAQVTVLFSAMQNRTVLLPEGSLITREGYPKVIQDCPLARVLRCTIVVYSTKVQRSTLALWCAPFSCVDRRLARHPVRPMPVELRHCESVERLAVAQLLREYPHPKSASPQASHSQRETQHSHHASAQGALGGTPPSQPKKESQGPQAQDRCQGLKPEGQGLKPEGQGLKPELNAWIRARGLSEASNDPRLHRCIIGYLSDFVLLGTSLAAHGLFPANPRCEFLARIAVHCSTV